MPQAVINASAALSPVQLNTAFNYTYKQKYEGVQQFLRYIMTDVTGQGLTNTFAYYETAPYPKRWVTGQTRGVDAFKAVSYSVTTIDWTAAVGWNANDKQDDQLGDLESQARMTADHWGTLSARIAAQYIEQATDADLMPTGSPNAPDGVDLWNGTDGTGGARFGVTGGNLHTGSGVDNAGQVRDDYHDVMARWYQFQDTEGQPLIDPGIIGQGTLIVYPPALLEVMRETFIQGRTVTVLAGDGTTDGSATAVAVAGTSNVILEAGDGIYLWCNPWLTSDTNDWFAFLIGSPLKPFYRVQRQAPVMRMTLMDTNDRHAVTTKEEAFWWDSRETFGINLPYMAQKVANS